MVERLCEQCDKPVLGKLYKGRCRSCYDKSREFIMMSIAKDVEKDFREYVGERTDRAQCVNELLRIAFKVIKEGKRVIIVPQ